MKYFFTSDTHYCHAGIIDHCKRPFKNVEHMNEILIRNFNSRVTSDDIVFFLGDFCFKSSGEFNAKTFLNRLNGNFIFILGNHDKNNGVKSCMTSAVIELGGKEIYLVHNPEDFHAGYELNLVGHVHNHWRTRIMESKDLKTRTIIYNVGVDVHSFYPIEINEIFKNIYKDLKCQTIHSNTKSDN